MRKQLNNQFDVANRESDFVIGLLGVSNFFSNTTKN